MAKGIGGSGRLSAVQRQRIGAIYSYQSGSARYAKNSVAVTTQSDSGFISAAGNAARSVGGRYSNREGAFIMSRPQFGRFQTLIKEQQKEVEARLRSGNRAKTARRRGAR